MIKKSFSVLLVIFIVSVFFSCVVGAEDGAMKEKKADDLRPFSILKAGEKGMFNMGPAIGDVVSEFDETVKKNVLKFDYTIFSGAIAGVWTKSFPSDFKADVVDAVKFAVRIPTAEQLRQVSVKLEIKGINSVQTVPLRLELGWNYFREEVDWNKIGPLKEVVFVVSPTNAGKRLEGMLYFDLDFYKIAPIEKYFTFVKIGLVFAVSFLIALIAAFIGRFFKRKGAAEKRITSDRNLAKDLLYGVVAALILAIGLIIYSIGKQSFLNTGINFGFLAVALAGAIIAELLKFGITGKHLKPVEFFQNILLTGLLAASSSRQEILQAPSSWIQLFMVNNLVAAIAFFIYQIFNARSLASSGKHLRPITGAFIVGTPYLFNWLLLVESVTFLQKLTNVITVGTLAAWPALLLIIGRVIVVFGFNEAVVNGIGLLVKDRALKTLNAHLYILLVSLGVVVAPLIADMGSTPVVASLPEALRAIAAILTVMLSYGGLWGEVYLITGILLDGGHFTEPSSETISKHVKAGMRKGMAYSGIVMGILYAMIMLLNAPFTPKIITMAPIIVGTMAGTLVFPFIKTIIETFDGSLPFFERVRYSYRNKSLCARGAIAGFGFAYGITHGFIQQPMPERITFGVAIGFLASGGVSLLRDIVYAFRGQGRLQSWRLYFVDSVFGVFIGSGVAFYLDSLQVPVLVQKFKLYTSSGFSPQEYITYPLVNKWGRIDLGTFTGGVKLLFTESLAGVINWSIAAWLFVINKVFMQAYLDKDKTPIKFFFSKAGFAQLIEHMIYVLRWGLWMSPIIFTGLRMMPNPTWYNQDGAIHTLFAIYNNVTMSSEAFRAWSLQVFVYIMAFDFFRILIWMDHMGLRVATLVNLSFLGLDKLDEKMARFIGPAAAQRYIPDAVKRFATWAPLLIPFYLPRGKEWDYTWSTSESIQNAAMARKGILDNLESLPLAQMLVLIAAAIFIFAGISFVLRLLRRRARARRIGSYQLSNREYKVVLKENGEVYSEVIQKECDISRRSYDSIDPCGRILYLVDVAGRDATKTFFWPVVGNFPTDSFEASRIEKVEDLLRIVNTTNGIRTTIDIGLPDKDSTAEIWKVTVENLTDKPRQLKIVPYLEWVLIGGIHDRFHTQYARLYPEMEYTSKANAILSWRKGAKAVGILAADVPPEGFIASRLDFIGRARSVWSPRILETLDFLPAKDTAPYPTFDPIGSLIMNAAVGPRSSATMNIVIGYAKDKPSALRLIDKHLKIQPAKAAKLPEREKKPLLIGHGEIPAGTPQPYFEFRDNGNKLLVHTPYTPRPFDHAMSNTVHSIMVTNRGLHTSSNGNSQQNRLTPDWPDIVTKEIPTEAIYLYDPDRSEWYSPTYHPLNDPSAKNESEFGVDGTAVFRMERADISTELTVFVPPEEPLGVYLLTIKNKSDHTRRMRIAPYFQMVLAFQPERSGPLQVRYDKRSNTLFFENPRNMFRSGRAFVSMSIPAERVEIKRGRFFGSGRGVTHPFMVEKGKPDVTQLTDDGQIASFLGTVELPAHGERTVAIILGETDKQREAIPLVEKYKNIEITRKSLEDTRKWWLDLMGTVTLNTNKPEFDRFQNWLKYQAIAERLWARRGFYQTSGAYGFRDQLQDTINLIWVDPALARKQIILHASQQFIEGDVFHWFFTLTDGRAAFSCRSHASDNPLWLVWGVVEYIKATCDYSILDEMAPYMAAQFPFSPLPKNKQGWGHLYHRSTRADSVYRHCLRSIDLMLEKRMGRHGLPLMGTGDWNDGLDAIGSEGKGESVWVGFFLYYILKDMVDIIERKEGTRRKEHYIEKMEALKAAVEKTWRGDRYLRAIHDDGTEIGVKDSGIWEIDALTAAWAVMTGINFERGLNVFNTALGILEKENVVLLGWPALREDSKPYLGRSSKYPEGVRENGMYCHGVQWLIKAARILAEEFEKRGDYAKADEYRQTAYRLWLKISPIPRTTPQAIELYGGQPNKQPADILTTFDPGRMIWHGYTGAAGWMLRQALEGVVGASLVRNELVLPTDIDKPRGELKVNRVERDVRKSPLKAILTSLLLIMSLFASNIYAAEAKSTKSQGLSKTSSPLVIADFSSDSLINNLGGESGAWERNPEDNMQWVNASLDNDIIHGKSGASLKLEYSVNSPNDAVNGFWTQLRNLDASPYDHFEFWVKGDDKKRFTTTFKIEFNKIQKDNEGHDETIRGSFVVKEVTNDWQKISIPLNVMNGILDWRDIKELIVTFEKRRVDKPEGMLYFDDFTFVKTGNPGPKVTDIVRHLKKKTEKPLSQLEFAEFLIGRLNGFPRKVFVKKEFPKDDRKFLLEIAKDTWKYFDNLVDKEYQLPLDNVQFSENATISKDTKVGDYTNITNVGVYLMCLVSAYDFGFISKEEAIRRLNLTLDSIERFEKYNNFPYNYYDITIFQRTSNFISFVDSGWLAAGIVVTKNAFPEQLGKRCQKMLNSMDFSFFYDPVEQHMYHGFYTNINYYSEYHYGAFYTEPRAISYIAIGKGDVPKEHWFKLARTFPGTWLWQTQAPKGQKEKVYLGYTTEGGYYVYDNMKFVPSWGGSMFEALMPTIIIDEKTLAPKGLGINDSTHVKIQIQYALEKLGYPVFGMSPSCVPEGGYSEYGVKPLGIKGYKEGVVTPHATFLALEFAPKECINNIRKMLELYQAYGEYGFYDAIDVKTGKVAMKYLCLDQAMSFLALNNYLNNGAIRKRFHADPIAENAEELLKVEDFFE